MLVPYYCKKCGKEFYPTLEHVYKDHTGMYCCWTCFDHHRKNKKYPYKRVELIDKNGEVIFTYKSARYAAEVVKGTEEDIRKACKFGTVYFGYRWRYAKDNKKKGEK